MKEWTFDKRSVNLIPANGKQLDDKGQTSSGTVMSRSSKLSEHQLASTKPREMETKEQLANDPCRYINNRLTGKQTNPFERCFLHEKHS